MPKTPGDARAGFLRHENPSVREMLEPVPRFRGKKPRGFLNFQERLETVAGGGTYFGRHRGRSWRNDRRKSRATGTDGLLTDREREILQLVAESHSTRESRRSSASA